MKTQKAYHAQLVGLMLMILILVGSFSVKQEALSYGNDFSGAGRGIYAGCNTPFYSCNQVEGAINYSLRIFFALILWMLSPVGILFFLGSGSLVSRRTSKLKRVFSWIAQLLALVIWLSFMILLMIVYLDSITLNVLGLGGGLLDTAIASGMAFFVVMFIFALYEKSIEYGSGKTSGFGKKKKDETEENRSGNGNEKKGWEGAKIAGAEFVGFKDKVRRKIKEGLKEIVDDEIERRL